MTPEKAVEILKADEERRIAAIYAGIKMVAIKALEKQIPKKTKIIHDHLLVHGNMKEQKCPACGNIVRYCISNGWANHIDYYCSYCGQRIDWSES